MIELDHVSKVYRAGRDELRALDDVSLTITEGEFVAIMGPSGSGKSTLMNILGCLDRPTEGEYRLGGVTVGDLTNTARAHIRRDVFGFIFQSYNLIPRMSVVRQVELPLAYQRAAHRRQRALVALDTVGLADRADDRPTELSGGQRQRVAIARTLVTNPRVIFADEPTGALDTKTGDDVMKLIGSLVSERGITVVLVTHEIEVAAHARRLIRMRDGRIIADVPMADALATPGESVLLPVSE
ncbi:MAG: ABC transporter ATP-binding protein [Dehalococcoidia bacterium]|nr:ABC transporter ATP-binding protein [Dehalococcoidia bacterium]